MAINAHIKTAYDARLAGMELKNCAHQLAFGLVLMEETNNRAAASLIQAVDQVGDDYIAWAEGKADTEEVFVPTHLLAETDQLEAELKNLFN